MSKETFKVFVRENPILANFVNNNHMTWQKFYEMYELYGSNNSIWDSYLSTSQSVRQGVSITEGAVKELLAAIKGINLEKIQNGITNIQKTISLVQDLSSSNSNTTEYEKRPVYRRFDD